MAFDITEELLKINKALGGLKADVTNIKSDMSAMKENIVKIAENVDNLNRWRLKAAGYVAGIATIMTASLNAAWWWIKGGKQ